MPKVVALPQQRLTSIDRQCIGQAVAEIQARGVAAASAEIRVGRSGQAGLALGYRLDDELGFFDKFIQCSADDRITLGVKDYPAFQVAGRRQSADIGVGERVGVGRGVVLVAQKSR